VALGKSTKRAAGENGKSKACQECGRPANFLPWRRPTVAAACNQFKVAAPQPKNHTLLQKMAMRLADCRSSRTARALDPLYCKIAVWRA